MLTPDTWRYKICKQRGSSESVARNHWFLKSQNQAKWDPLSALARQVNLWNCFEFVENNFKKIWKEKIPNTFLNFRSICTYLGVLILKYIQLFVVAAFSWLFLIAGCPLEAFGIGKLYQENIRTQKY